MATPAYVRHASTAVGGAFSRYASVQINHGTGNNRVLLAWVTSDQSDVNNNFAACHAGCTSAGSIAGGVAMTPVAAAPNDESGRQQGRLFWLAGASLPAGTSWVVGDATYADRRPGILAVLFEDTGGGPITVSAFSNISALSSSLANSIAASGSTGNAERAVFVGAIYTPPTPTAPTVLSSADTAGLATVFERNGAASSTTMAWTHTSNGFAGGTMVVLAGTTVSNITGNITADEALPAGVLGAQTSSVTGSITLDATLPTGQLAGFPGNTVRTLPFSRNSGARPVSLPANAIAVLSDNDALTRIAGASNLTLGVDGRLTFSDAALPAPGTSVIAVTREADGRLGVERYQVVSG
jgi:hypothetical protein